MYTSVVSVTNDPNMQLSKFKISKKWIMNFMKRNALSPRHCTTVLLELPETYDEKQLEFQWYIEDLGRWQGLLLGHVGTTDQTPV